MTQVGPTLADIKQSAAVDHVLTAARRFVIEHGLDATMDQLAVTSGVSRRTLFRMFGTRENLIARAFTAGMADYVQQLPEFSGDVDSWLRATCDAIHRMNAVTGPGFWELTSRSRLPAELAELEQSRRRDFNTQVLRVSRTLWNAGGGRRQPPDMLRVTIGAHFSPHFTGALLTELDGDWQTASILAYEAITAALARLRA